MPQAENFVIDLGQRQAATEARTDNHEKHLDRVDETLERLTEVSITLKEIVKHQDHSIKNNKMAIEGFSAKFENRMAERDKAFELVNSNIKNLETKFDEKISKVESQLGDSKGVLEKWKWVFIVIGAILFFIVNNFELIAKFFAAGSA